MSVQPTQPSDDRTALEVRFDELKHSGALPSPSSVGLSILCLTQRDDVAMDEMVKAIQVDPALTGRILKVANSAMGASTAPVTTVLDAAVRLGSRVVSNIALGFCVISGNRHGTCKEFDYDRFWSTSLAHAIAAQGVSRHSGIGSPPQAFLSALLSRVGTLALASVHTTEYSEVLIAGRGKSSEELIALETRSFKINHREVCDAMLSDWGLPAPICFTAAYYEQAPAEGLSKEVTGQVMVLRRSAIIAEFLMALGKDQDDAAKRLDELRLALDMPVEGFRQLFDAIVSEWREWGAMLKIPTHEVCFPATLASQGVINGIPPKVIDPNRLTILAVDDDSVSLRILSHHLIQAGHNVLVAPNGKAGLAVALQMTPQIVITDWMMPEMDGIELCKALRRFEIGQRMYVLLLTGREEEDRIVEAFEAGVDDYITKPFKPRLLLARVRAGQRVVRLQEQVARDKILQLESISKLAVMARQLRKAAMTDMLTEIPNRRFAMKRLQEEWAHHARSGEPLSVVAFDVDHFKKVNDTYGHDVGDVVLKEVAKVLSGSTRTEDICARMGGEEFLVVCRSCQLAPAAAFAERVRKSMAAHLINCSGFHGSVTVSAGVAPLHPSMTSVDELLKAADVAVYQAKADGRNRVSAWQPDVQGKASA